MSNMPPTDFVDMLIAGKPQGDDTVHGVIDNPLFENAEPSVVIPKVPEPIPNPYPNPNPHPNPNLNPTLPNPTPRGW